MSQYEMYCVQAMMDLFGRGELSPEEVVLLWEDMSDFARKEMVKDAVAYGLVGNA